MSKPIRKTFEQSLEVEPEMNQAHIDDWHFGSSRFHFERLKEKLPESYHRNFNFQAAITNPKSIRFRQMDSAFEIGRRGDYLFVDKQGGKMGVPCNVFKIIFP